MFNGSMRNAGAMGMLAALMGASLFGGEMYGSPTRFIPEEKPERPCLRCGTMHQHNNSFCSAECCRSYAAENKNRSRCKHQPTRAACKPV